MITAWRWEESFLPKNGGPMYGWFFFLWIGIMVLELIFLLPVAAKQKKKTTDRVILTYGIILTLAEIYKQVFFTIERGSYPWDLFPWQFCSVPMFAAVIGPLVRKEAIKNSIYKFLSFFGLIAGIMTLILPEGLYWDYVTLTCHSFFWHTTIVVMGMYLIVANGYAKSIKNLIKEWIPSAIVFAIATIIAMTLDVLWWFLARPYLPEGTTFNMFYISPFFNSSLPVFRDWQPVLPYPVFLMLYIVAFSIGAAVIWAATYGIRKFLTMIRKKR